jgi:hypothetical protein
MENTPITITLTIQQWTQILNCLSLAPFQAVNTISEAVSALQTAAAPQVEEAAKKAAAEAEAAPAAE